MSVADLRGLVGKDLWALVERLNTPLTDVDILTPPYSAESRRASFRFQLADGRILKGRRVETAGQAERVEYLWQFLDRGHFPRLLARSGAALLIEWVAGKPLAAADGHADLFRRCGALHGRLHSTALPEEAYARYQPALPVDLGRRSRLERNIHDLVKHGAFTTQEGEGLLDLSIAHAPSTAAVGMSHGDFFAENMVLRAPGALSVIDNETLSIDASDRDLARTWHLWSMSPAQREAYYDGYNRYRSSADFVKDFPYWLIVVLASSAVFRLRTGTRDALVPIRRLRAILRDDGRDGNSLRSELLMKEKDA